MALEYVSIPLPTGTRIAVDQLTTAEHVQYMKLLDGTPDSMLPLVITANGAQVEAQGAIASGSLDSGNPVKVGSVYHATAITGVDGSRLDFQSTINGFLKVELGSALGGVINNVEADNVGTVPYRRSDAFQATYNSSDASAADAPIKTATASKRHYVSDLVVSTGSAITVTFKNGSTVIGSPLYMAANSTVSVRFSTPWQMDINTAINVRTSAAGNVTVWMNGYTI